MVGSSTALQDAIAAVRELKRFNGKGQPISEAEYRFYFLQATQGLADEEIARLWVNNIEYKSPAHVWLDTLRNDPNRKDKAEKWSTLQPEIEKHWPSPPLDFDAQRDVYRRDWDEHRLDLQKLKEEIESGKAGTRPLQAWAKEHKARARNVNSTDEDRVSKTIRVDLYDGWLVNLLPKRDGYYDKFDELMKDIGSISLRSLISGWEQESLLEVFVEVAKHVVATASPASDSCPIRYASQTECPVARSELLAARPSVSARLDSATADTAAPASSSGPRRPSSHAGPASTTGHAADSLRAHRIGRLPLRSLQPAPAGATLIPDTPESRTQWAQKKQEWANTHGQVWPELDKPYPLTPGTYEPTANLCTRCGKGNHYYLYCQAPMEESLGDLERDYRKKVRNALRNERRAGSQPSTPTPGQRYRETNQVEFSEPESEPESMGYLSGNE
ncbi:Retrovirus-related Pol polyprotein from transposon [Ceratobasidium sp. AG-Ba]|nr:Retrovirus-related Pol polyprotein from transposon [Ceratobasidium sp. AG-Ba]